MKKTIAILIVLAIILLSTTTVMAGGGKVQKLNPDFNQLDDRDHNVVSHRFQEIEN